MGEVFLAHDASTQQLVALKVVRDESRQPGDDEALRQEALLARTVGHPNVCRVHDLAPSPWGPILVMEHIPGQTLHAHIRRKKTSGGYEGDEFRRIAAEICGGLAAIHAAGLVHGDLKPANVMVTDERAIILDFGFAQERARAAARRPNAPPDGGTPNYMSPERIRSGGASEQDDLYALALTLWEMWTCRVPEPAYKPRAKPMRQQIMFDVPAALSIDEVKQVFNGLSADREQRPPARYVRFFNPVRLTTTPLQVPRPRLDAGPPIGRAQMQSFQSNAQALLVTYASNAPDSVGELLALERPELALGRHAGQDLCIPEATVSGMHAKFNWQGGSWIIEDLGSTNGSYADHEFERKKQLTLIHGGEVQVGEARIKLVNFQPGSKQHQRARDFLQKRDGLTGLLVRDHLLRAVTNECEFAEWYEVPMQVARYELRGPNRQSSERPTILEMLALRRAAGRVVELTEMLTTALLPIVAGRTGPLRFIASMVGPSLEEARHIVEQVVGQVRGIFPDNVEFVATLIKWEPGRSASSLVE
ncbi:MAG: FHA domain-containing protein [Myxococcales bacterium]|nr:FHA domain-containing protein [Myxococcales bacterium]